MILFDDKGNELWNYQTSGNFHSADLSFDGSYVAAATGCPDRRAYIFSRDSEEPLVRSEMLTRDSPVHASAISDDGEYAAFGAESDAGAVHLFKTDSKETLWKLPAPQNKSVRSLAMTPNGQYIGAATFGGDAYILSRESSNPLRNFKVQERLGTADISDDGFYLAVGGSNNGVYLFGKEDSSPLWQNTVNEFVNTLDISSDGKYVAVGTGASIYFFESDEFNPPRILECEEIFEPPSEEEMWEDDLEGELAECGDNMCELEKGESPFNCPADCKDLGEGEFEHKPKEDKGFPLIEVLSLLGGLIILTVLIIILWRRGFFRRICRKLFSKDKNQNKINLEN